MRAVNLIPSDGRRGIGAPGGLPQGPSYVLLGLLALALVFVTIYVLTANTISERKAKLASLHAQTAQVQAQAAQLTNYAQFAQLARARAQTVREIASSRFDWHRALSDLSKVVAPNTNLLSLFGSVAPGATIQGGSGTGTGSSIASVLRSDLSVPAFELTGCGSSQDDVARLMSRLRLVNGVTRVTLGDSVKQDGAGVGAPANGGGSSGKCPANKPTFDLVAFFQTLPGAGPNGATNISVSATGTSAAPGSSPVSSPSTGGAAPVSNPSASGGGR